MLGFLDGRGSKGDIFFNSGFQVRPMATTDRNFTVVIEQDEDGMYVGSVPALKGCHSQGRTVDELMENITEAIELCLEVEDDVPAEHFVGVRQVHVRL